MPVLLASDADLRIGRFSRSRNSVIRSSAVKLLPQAILPVAIGVLILGITGCGSSSSVVTQQPPPGSFIGVGFGGRAMAGKQPLIGASVQLYLAGTSGNGSVGASILSSPLTTDSSGAFTIPSGYSCPAGTSQTYLAVRGGKPGAAATSANNAIAFLTATGACNQITPSSQFVANEVTTVASAYALSQFLSAGANLGSTSTNTVGFQNAVATASALADQNAGTSPGPSFPANGTSPAPTINTLANLLNACTSGSTSNCNSLFAATTILGSSAPTNTLDAVLNLVHNPAASVGNLFTLSAGSSVFAPILATKPPDWTLYIDYSGGGMNGPSGLGVDSSGNVWVASYFNVASVFSPLGKPLLPSGITGSGLSASYGLAVDAQNHAWIPNEPSSTAKGNSVSVLDSTGQSYAGTTGFTGAGLDFPIAIAIDPDSSVWVVDYGNSHLTHLSSSGQALSGPSGYTSPTLAFPVAAAIDSSHNVWIANQSAATVTKVSPDGSQFTSYSCCNGPSNLAIDRLGNVWVANYYGDSISEISSAGIILANGAYTGGGINHPQGIAIDGAGNVWIANFRAPNITEFAGASVAGTAPGQALSPAGGLGSHPALNESFAIAVDASGNLWVSNFGSNTLTQFIGLAVPVRTPTIGPSVAP